MEKRRKEENPHGTGSEKKQAQLHRCNTPVQGCYSHPMPINVIRYLKTKSNIRQQAIKSATIEEGAAAGTHREEAKRKGNTDFVMDDDGCGLRLWPWWRCKDGGGNRNDNDVAASPPQHQQHPQPRSILRPLCHHKEREKKGEGAPARGGGGDADSSCTSVWYSNSSLAASSSSAGFSVTAASHLTPTNLPFPFLLPACHLTPLTDAAAPLPCTATALHGVGLRVAVGLGRSAATDDAPRVLFSADSQREEGTRAVRSACPDHMGAGSRCLRSPAMTAAAV
uniref:Uncharacterized protein n=1 Tax=Oryza nivara TaxID=4536 RepID=A0A0E0I952_ORYNI